MSNIERIKAAMIIKRVCDAGGVTLEEVAQHRGGARVINARNISIMAVRNETELSLNQIKTLFAFKNHTSVIRSKDRGAELIEEGKRILAMAGAIAGERSAIRRPKP